MNKNKKKFFDIFIHEKHGIKFIEILMPPIVFIITLVCLLIFKACEGDKNIIYFTVGFLCAGSIINFLINLFIMYRVSQIGYLLRYRLYANLIILNLYVFHIYYFFIQNKDKTFSNLIVFSLLSYAIFSVFTYLLCIIKKHFIDKIKKSPNNNHTYSFKSKLFFCIFCECIIIVLSFNSLFVSNVRNLFLNITLLLFIPLILSFIVILIFPNFKSKDPLNNRISKKFINLDYKDIIKNRIYIEGNQINKGYRVFKINLAVLLNDKIEKLNITNLCSVQSDKFEQASLSNDYFYIAKNYNEKSDCIVVKLQIKYKNNNMIHKIILIVYFKHIKREIIISNFEILDNYKTNISFFRDKPLLPNYDPICDHLYDSLFFYNYQLDDDFMQEIKKEINSEYVKYNEKKWLFHNADFGKGKTVKDLYIATESNYFPVVISAFEEQSKKDFLYSIYKSVYDAVPMPSIKYSKEVYIFLLLIMTSIYTIILSNFTTFADTLRVESLFQQCSTIINEYISTLFGFTLEPIVQLWGFLIIILPTIIYFLVRNFLPNIVMYKKDSSFYYQEFFFKEISRMLKKNNAVLIIEDIDRLNSQTEVESIFSTLCALNSYNAFLPRVIGSISLDIDRMKNLTSELNSYMENIENKMVMYIIDTKKDNESIILYIENVKKLLSELYQINNISISQDDFRTARSEITKILNYHE